MQAFGGDDRPAFICGRLELPQEELRELAVAVQCEEDFVRRGGGWAEGKDPSGFSDGESEGLHAYHEIKASAMPKAGTQTESTLSGPLPMRCA